MIIQKLEDGWKLRDCSSGVCFDTKVPGTVFGTWLECGAMEDPYWGDREDQALAMMEADYEYSLTVTLEKEVAKCETIWLRFEGIDTLADIWLNGLYLGQADNMHRIWQYPVKQLVKAENKIRVLIHSPLPFIRKAYEEDPYDGAPESMKGFPFLRKAHCSFGWDWGPRLPDAGLFRNVALIGAKRAVINGAHIRQSHGEEAVVLSIYPEIETFCKECVYSWDVRVMDPEGTLTEYPDSPKTVTIPQPKLWWPNGYGEQPLYLVELVLKEGNEILDEWSRKIGLRTIKMNTDKDEYGRRFAHEVNGVEIFAMGADYIPEDCIRGRVSRVRTKKLLEHCRECNFNVIRVWGGGYYPDDFFYDLCDELGLVVWQDFMFACAIYPLTPEFEENVKAEIRDNVKRIRHHPCLGLWCGNNEMEMFISANQWIRKPVQKTEYLIMNERIIPELLKQYDPDTFYWPSSPSSGGDFDIPNDPDRGDVHYWEVWHGGVPFTEYRKFYFRYLSEFGFQSFPSLKTIESFTEAEDRNIFSYVMEKHQRNNGANGKILQYMSQMYRYPESFSHIVYVSQLLQAEAIRYGVEHFRRNRGRCMGCVYWQLNDCWPAASWSSIDYGGRWKALHYFARRFFAPVLLSCEEEGALTGSMDVNEENRTIRNTARFYVTNETRVPFQGAVCWSLRSSRSDVLKQGKFETRIAPLSVEKLPLLDFSEMDGRECYLSYSLYQEEVLVSHGFSLFVPPKHFVFCNPKLKVWTEGDEIFVKAEAYAKGVEIGNRAGDLLLSDNYFDMDSGIKKVRIADGGPEGLYARSIYEIGRSSDE